MSSYRVYSDVPLSSGLPPSKKFSHPTLQQTPIQCLKNSQENTLILRKKASAAALESSYFFEVRNLSNKMHKQSAASLNKIEVSQLRSISDLKELQSESEYGLNDNSLKIWSPKFSTQMSAHRSTTRFSQETLETQANEMPLPKALLCRKNSLQIHPVQQRASSKGEMQEKFKVLKMNCSSAIPLNKKKQIIEQEGKRNFLSLKPVGENFKVNILDNMKHLSLNLNSTRRNPSFFQLKKPIRVISTPYKGSRAAGNAEMNELVKELPRSRGIENESQMFPHQEGKRKLQTFASSPQARAVTVDFFKFFSPKSQGYQHYSKAK